MYNFPRRPGFLSGERTDLLAGRGRAEARGEAPPAWAAGAQDTCHTAPRVPRGCSQGLDSAPSPEAAPALGGRATSWRAPRPPGALRGPLTSIFRPQPPSGDGVPRTTGEPAWLEKRVNTPRKGAVALSE